MSTIKKQQKRVLLWVAAALFAFSLASAPVMTGSAEAACSVYCVGTTGLGGD